MQGGKAFVTGSESLGCGHCAAVCPAGAVRVTANENETLFFQSFKTDETWLPYGQYDISGLVRLMRSRRSCRNYAAREVDRSLLEDLVRIGITAPSGTNSQRWAFTLLPVRPDVMALGEKIGGFFRKLNQTAEKAWLRRVLKLMGNRQLEEYYRSYYETVKQALREYETTGSDRLFHKAPAAIIVSAAPGGSCSPEDALLATQNILLGAHAMGLGTCLIGFAVTAMKKDKHIQKSVGIPPEETVHAVIALGYPDVLFQRVTGRKQFVLRYA
jgi:nitroreductase